MLVELSVVEQRYHAVMEVLAGGVPVAEVAERYGVSRKSVHAWLNRYRAEGMAGLSDRSHRPRGHPLQLAAEVEAQLSLFLVDGRECKIITGVDDHSRFECAITLFTSHGMRDARR